MVLELLVLVYSVILHEVAHGWTAKRLGDYTASSAGRLTLNPISHIDPFLTVLLPLTLLFIGSPVVLAGAKPVPINPNNFKRHNRDIALTAASGPLVNLVIAVIFAIIINLFNLNLRTYQSLTFGIYINILLLIFNLLPIPPLDGSKVIGGFLPKSIAQKWLSLEKYGLIFILLILMSFNVLINNIILPLANYILRLLINT